MWRHVPELVKGYVIIEYLYMLLSYLAYPIIMLMTKDAWWGTQTTIHCALCPFHELQSGKYYMDCKLSQEKMPNKNWNEEAKQFWDASEKLIKDYI
jgi:hypothetical protein